MDQIHYIGHSSLWITLDDVHFILDANFSKRLFGFIKRQNTVGLNPAEIPDTAALLVTNGRRDNLDIFSYKYFSQDKPLLAPDGLGIFISRFLHNPLTEMKPWDTRDIQGVQITATPTKSLGLPIRGSRQVLSTGFVLKGKTHTVYVSGDTGYGPHFMEINRRFTLDAACLPIASHYPRWIQRHALMNPEECLHAFTDLKAKTLIPTAWGAFQLGMTSPKDPLVQLKQLIRGNPNEEAVHVLEPGEKHLLG